MEIIQSVAEMCALADGWQAAGKRVGLVPTMGYLHQGHLSLMQAARRENELVAASIFVNPTQFGPNEDFERYPRDLARDAAAAEAAGVDLLFCPEVAEIYPDSFVSYVEPAGLTDCLCGKSRPGHFRGVCTVVLKLFNIIRPQNAYFGQKDAQQYFILRQMAEDLNLRVNVLRLPIVREPDGLALSSRNVYLTEAERAEAPAIRRALQKAEQLFAAGERDAAVLRAAALAGLEQMQLARLDYLEIVDTARLQPLQRVDREALVATAVFLGKTRLIDNTILEP